MESHCRNICLFLLTLFLSLGAASTYKPVIPVHQKEATILVKSPILFRFFPLASGNNTFTTFIITEVQYDFLQFFEHDGQYRAHAQLEFTFSDAEHNQTFSRLVDIRASTGVFDSTNLKTVYQIRVDSLTLPVGNYTVVVVYRDVNSGRTVKLNTQLALRYRAGRFYSNPLFCYPDSASSPLVPFCANGRPSALSDYWDFNRDARWVLHVWGISGHPQPLRISVRDRKNGKPALHIDTTVTPDPTFATVSVALPLSRLEEGAYDVVIDFPETTPRIRFTVPLNIVWFTKPLSLWSLKTAIPPLKYILPQKEFEALQQGNRQEQERRFRALWKARDPDPDTPYNAVLEEFYRRVDEANRRWSTRRRAGWETDRGKVFIVYGEPDETEDRTLAPEPPQYLKWIYYRNGERIVAIFDAIEGRKILKLRTIVTEDNHDRQ